MKRIILILSAVIFIIANVGLSQDIINETGKDGKFIVRDAEQQEAMIIEDGNVEITGELKIDTMTEGNVTDEMVVWDKEDKSLKVVPRVFNKVSPLSEPLETRSWHSIGYEQVDDDGNLINASVQGTAANWNVFTTDNGEIRLGPANSFYAHIFTDRTRFLFNKPLTFLDAKFGSSAGQNFRIETGGTARITIDGTNGNVGIGTTSPGSKLSIEDSQNASSTTAIVAINNTAASGQNMLDFQYNGITRGRLRSVSSGNFYIESKANNNIIMMTNNEVRMTIENDGDIGIGTFTPEGALDIVSTTGALIVPRMTTTQRGALATVNGSIIYNTSTDQFNFYESGSWVTK